MITFYPTAGREEVNKYVRTSRILLVASSFATREVRTHGRVRRAIPLPRLSESVTDRAADWGGFTVTFKHKGESPFTIEQYVDWLLGWSPNWAATMDFCCEDEITSGRPGIVRERQQRTTEMAWRFWRDYRAVPWCWTPTIQGWSVEDYQRHATEMQPLIQEMQASYGQSSAWRVGIGTLCRRASIQMIHDVVRAVSSILPGVPLHLWGIKLGALQSPLAMPENVVSVDSAAWDGLIGRGNEEWKASGLRRGDWSWKIGLKRYEEKVQAALSVPKQMAMF